MMTVDGVFVASLQFYFFFPYRNEKQMVFVAFFRYIWIGNKTSKWKKAHIHHFMFKRWAEFSYINCLDNRSHCVCIQTRRVCVCICCSTLCSHQLNRKILKQWHFQQSLKFHQKPKRYNSSVTIGNGILIEGTKSTLKHTLAHTHTLAAQVYNKRRKKHPNIIKVKRRWMNKKIETQMYKPKNHNNNNRHNWNKYINDTLNIKSIEK